MQELIAVIQALVTLGSVVTVVLILIDKFRWTEQYRAAKDAQIAQAQETVKAKDAHIAEVQERVKAKDDHIDLLKSQLAPNALSVLNAQEALREKAVAILDAQLAELKESHARSEEEFEREIDDLRGQLVLTNLSLFALRQATNALQTEARSIPLTAVLAEISGTTNLTAPAPSISRTANNTPPPPAIRAEHGVSDADAQP